jgi:hypothetical protein
MGVSTANLGSPKAYRIYYLPVRFHSRTNLDQLLAYFFLAHDSRRVGVKGDNHGRSGRYATGRRGVSMTRTSSRPGRDSIFKPAWASNDGSSPLTALDQSERRTDLASRPVLPTKRLLIDETTA